MNHATAIGLEGIRVAETELSHVDGQAGQLIIRGRRLEDLAGVAAFESALSLLWTGALTDDFQKPLGLARMSAWEQMVESPRWLDCPLAIDAIRRGIACFDSSGDPMEDGIRVAGAIPVIAAAWLRRQRGEQLVAPTSEISHAEDYLRMLLGIQPAQPLVDALNTYLVAVIDHGLNASTFAARVVASTRSDLVSCITAAIGALKGPLHGGAPGPVLDMLDAIGAPSRAEAWIVNELNAGRRIMGMGHRVYRVRDPRAMVLERAYEALPLDQAAAERRELARAAEQAAAKELAVRKPERPIYANVEFYTAVLLERLGIPRSLFTATFAVGRVGGWCAHVVEEQARGRLIRPSALYVGSQPTEHGA